MSATWETFDLTKPDLTGAVTNGDTPGADVEAPAPRGTDVARTTGRGLGTAAGHLATGVREARRASWRYIRATDMVESIEPRSPGDWQYIHEVRRKRWIVCACNAGAVAVGSLGAWIGMVAGAGLTAVPGLEAAATTESAVAAIAATLAGRHITRRRAAAELEAGEQPLAIGPGDIEDDGEPFPLAWCKDGDQVRTCIQRALGAEGIGTRSITVLGYRGWGWEIDIHLKGSTPGKVVGVADQIDAHLDLKQGGTLIETDEQRAAHIIMRLVTSNPFATMAKPTIHAPNSLNISDAHHFGVCMDGSPLNLVLEGLRILTIGVSGAAKSTGVLRDLAEVITACDNAIALDFDPVKDGLREFEGVMAAPPIRGNEACEEWLGYLVRIAKARNSVRTAMKMGDTWVATRSHPAIFGFFDEYIYMSPRAKELFIELLRIGKQSGIYPIAAGQDATSDAMGDAIADSFTLKIMLASRWEDIRIVFGQGSAAKGYRPDRLVPAQNKQIKNDAGQSYIKGAGITRPLLYGWNEHARTAIERAVQERAAAGRPWFDVDSLAAADLLHVITQKGSVSGSSVSLADRLDTLAVQGGIDDARLLAVLMREFELSGESFLPTATVLLPALRNTGWEGDAELLGRTLRKHAPGVTTTRDNTAEGKPRGWTRDAIEQAAAGLLNPAQARSQAG